MAGNFIEAVRTYREVYHACTIYEHSHRSSRQHAGTETNRVYTTVVAAYCAHCQLRTPYLGLLAALTQSANDVFREGEAGINDISSIFSSSSKCALVEHFRLCVGATTFFIAISAARSSFSMLPRAPHSQLFLVKNNIPR